MKKLIAVSLILFAGYSVADECGESTAAELAAINAPKEDIHVAMYDEAYPNNLPATASGRVAGYGYASSFDDGQYLVDGTCGQIAE